MNNITAETVHRDHTPHYFKTKVMTFLIFIISLRITTNPKDIQRGQYANKRLVSLTVTVGPV